MSKKVNRSGERLETFMFSDTTLEHLHRYALAMELAVGKKVLDVACGEGYGTALLAGKASFVSGVDIDHGTIEKAKNKYLQKNISFHVSSILSMPFEDNNFDIITCFETLEHIAEHEQVIKELKRVLKKDGILIISTPDKFYYSKNRKYDNPFHIKEIAIAEFKTLISQSFNQSVFLTQNTLLASIIIENETPLITQAYTGNFKEISQTTITTPMYAIAIASDTPIPEINLQSLFHNELIKIKYFDELRNNLRGTFTYKLGHFILWPVKFIVSFFKKKGDFR